MERLGSQTNQRSSSSIASEVKIVAQQSRTSEAIYSDMDFPSLAETLPNVRPRNDFENSANGLSELPIIGRRAGLPARELDSFGSPEAMALLGKKEQLANELAVARAAMVETIVDKLSGFEANERRFLLNVKRSCFNGREIGHFSEKPEWKTLLQVSAPLAEKIRILEAEIQLVDRAIEATYRRDSLRERRHLLGMLENQKFLRGVAIGRSGLIQKARSQAKSLSASGFEKSAARWEDSLLRFLTRAVCKMSAQSTLTSWLRGSLRQSSTVFHFDGEPQNELSLVRLDRPQAEQFQALLLRHPEVRRQALVAFNDSVEEFEPGRYRLVRAGGWELEPQTGEFRYGAPVRVRSGSRPGLAVTRAALEAGPLRYAELSARLEGAGYPDALEDLLGAGFLVLLPPWPSHECRLEQKIDSFLKELASEDPGLRATQQALRELIDLQSSYATAAHPEVAVNEMAAAFSRLIEAAAPFAGCHRVAQAPSHFFEDVLYEPRHEESRDRGVFQVSTSAVEEIQRVANLLIRFDSLFDLRHDVQHTLAAWWKEHMPGRTSAPFNEVAAGFASVWGAFLEFQKDDKEAKLGTFNPLGSPALVALRQQREWLIASVRSLLERSPGKDYLEASALSDLLDTLPSRYAPLFGPSVFVQPVDAEGSSWVFNNVTPATGRYLSRVVPSLPESFRERFLAHLIERSVVDVGGEEADLLEVKHPFGHLTRVHPPQTRKVLELRGMNLGLPRERCVSLNELSVEADLENEVFRLRDRSGRRVLPLSLSAISDTGLPNRLRFLVTFGAGDTRGVFPFSWIEGGDEAICSRRLTCNQVVLRRRTWSLAVESLRARLENTSDRQAYEIVGLWRQRIGLPLEGFYYEQASCGKSKPQFVRFDSPTLSRLFVSSLRRERIERLHFTEALPAPKDFSRDELQDRRGFELLIDTLAIRLPMGDFPWETEQ